MKRAGDVEVAKRSWSLSTSPCLRSWKKSSRWPRSVPSASSTSLATGARSRTRHGAECISQCLRSRRTLFRSAIKNASRCRVKIPVPPVTEDLIQERDQEHVLQKCDQERVAAQSEYPSASGHGGASSGARS